MSHPDLVLVTGASGFLGSHITLELLRQGIRVRGSFRDIAKAEPLRQALAGTGVDVSRFESCVLDLTNDAGWAQAVAGCRFVQHVASPFVLQMPTDENDLIRPAVEGTRRALQAALAAGVERIVLTSSLAAIDCGHTHYDRIFTTTDWTDLSGPNVNAYTRSKTLAEREAWSITEQAGARNRLATINPGAILGPLLDDDPGTSGTMIQRLLQGLIPMAPDITLPYVDVRDVAQAHVAAMLSPAAGGRRHIISNEVRTLSEVAATLRTAYPHHKLPKTRMPNWFAAVFALFDKSLRDSRAYLGIHRRYDASSGTALLGRQLISTADAVLATGRSLVARGLV